MIVIVIAGIFIGLGFLLRAKSDNIPMVDGGLPFFGHVFTMMKGSPWDTMSEWTNKYGTICKFHLFGSDAICVADPSLLKIILQTKLNSFKKDVDWTYKPFMVLLGSGLVTSEGSNWSRQRRLLASHLKFDILGVISTITFAAVNRLIAKLEKARENNDVIDMADEFRHLTLQVISEAVLSLTPEECDQTFAVMYLPIVEEGNLRTWDPSRMYLPTPSWFKFRRDVQRLNDYVTGLVEARWALRQQLAARGQSREPPDVLDKILAAIAAEEWSRAVREQVRDEIKTFILAGHETSASMLAWALHELSLDSGKELAQQVLDESTAVYAPSSEDGVLRTLPDKERLDRLVFTECCLRESLRKYSNVPTVVRVAAEDVQVGDYHLPKGATVMVSMQGVHHNAQFWPEPWEYRPSRFRQAAAPFTFLPFIDGPRSCVGQFLALLESKIALSMLLTRFRFEAVDAAAAGEKHPFMVPIIPKAGHPMRIRRRL
jgi:cytochrome P450